MNRRSCLLMACLVGAAGCAELVEYRTAPDEVYRGHVIGLDNSGGCDGGPCSAFRRGFSAGSRLELRFDPTDAQGEPGTLSTVGQACGAEVFENTPLVPISALLSDSLALYDFPGGGRVKNYIFSVTPETGPLAARDPLAFVSLMRNGDVEVRIVAGSGRVECDPADCVAFAEGRCDFFGVFRTVKESESP